jgi:histidyl-tRNA synthetase
MRFQAIKGTRDILPPESALWNRAEQAAREVFAAYGYGEIRLPIFEQTELFARSIGVETDVVAKEMYTFHVSERFGEYEANLLPEPTDAQAPGIGAGVGRRTGVSHTLRPEATASVCRAYIEHGMHTRPGNVKLYYIGPMFRRERPQKGRYRQFYQIGAEVLGPSDAPAIDAEVIEMLMHFFARAGLSLVTLYINSIGCRQCRPEYVEKLRATLIAHINDLKADSQRRVETNPLRVLDSKLPEEQAVIETLPRITGHLCEACRAHYEELKRQLQMRNLKFEENWRLVRGLDYYMRTTFEITAPGLGAQNAVCGGGRYDGLVELLGGPPTKGIGFAIGTDRLILALQSAGALPGYTGESLDLFIAWMGAAAQSAAVKIARMLRESGLSVEVPAEEMKFRKSLDLANRLGARYALIIGEEEVKAGQYTLKRLSDGAQSKLRAEEIAGQVTRSL